MRRVPIVAVIIILLSILLTSNAFAGGYFAIGGGAGGEADAPNLTLEAGNISTDKNINRLIGIGFDFIFNADAVPDDTLEYPVPHSDYSSLGTRQKGNEYGLFGKYGLEFIKNKGVC